MWNWITQAAELQSTGTRFALVTVTRCSGSTPRETGAKMIVLGDGRFFGTIGGGGLERQSITDARQCLSDGTSKTIQYPLHAAVGQCCGGIVEILVEVMNSGPRLYVFGAGHVGQALARTLSDTPFVVHLIDERAEWLSMPGLPSGIVKENRSWRDFIASTSWDGESARKAYVAIMTHDHGLDREILAALLDKPVRYLGMIGSESKWASFQEELQRQGATSEQLLRVHCPIGLNVGGKSPQEVAISIAAEVLQIHYGR